jgi:hypothetical protein
MGKQKYKPHGRETKLRQYVKLDDLGEYIRQKYDGYRLTEQTIQFCMAVAAGENSISAVKDIYTLHENNAEARRQAKEMLLNPKIVETINIIRDNIKHQTIVDTNSILMRLELMYGDCIEDNDRANALKVLKQMADIVGKMDGTVSVGDVVIRFELPNPIGAKKIDVEATDVEEI